jgi:hypothetical protein
MNMGKYDPLFRYLNSNGNPKVILSYVEIENILSAKLPNSAYEYKEWWDNNSHVQSKFWRDAGYQVDTVFLGDKVIFIKEKCRLPCDQTSFCKCYNEGTTKQREVFYYEKQHY